MRILSSLSYGDDGYFFLYDMQGNTLMHPRQPELVGQNLWACAMRRQPDHPEPDAARQGGGGWSATCGSSRRPTSRRPSSAT
jgi:two-component system NarL family sensor kinase